MVIDRKINWLKLILAFFIAVFLFSFGLFLGYVAKGIISQTTVNLEQSVKNDIVNLETLFLIEEDYPCNNKILDIASERLDYLGELISVLEVKKGKNSEDVLELKKLYTILEIRHYLLINSRNQECGESINTFLFFYSNQEECKGEVEKSSFILSFLRKKYDNKVRVYSFDVNLLSDIVQVLKEQYEINGCSGIILNNEKIKFKPQGSGEIEILLD